MHKYKVKKKYSGKIILIGCAISPYFLSLPIQQIL